MKLTFKAETLYFKHSFKIAHGSRDSTPIILTQLEHEGKIGYGEGSMPPYLEENHKTASLFLTKAALYFQTIYNPFDMDSILSEINLLVSKNCAAKASIDIALHDLVGKLLNKPCWQMFGADKNKTPFTSYTLGIDEPEIIKQKLEESESYKIIKVKLNGKDDRLIIETIRKITNKPIVIDVNQGWKNKEQAIEMIEWLQNKNVLFVEQPLKKDNLEDAYWLFQRSPLLLFADESIQRLTDIEKVKDCFHGINIKLMKCTGMREANKMIVLARELKLKILMGCMSETSCAVSAAAQLTSFVDYADLDGPLLIKNNLFEGIQFINGKIILNDLPGNGVLPVGK